jgi:hypothetical protein
MNFSFSNPKAETLLYVTGHPLASTLYSAAFLCKVFRQTANSFAAAATFILPELYSAVAQATATLDHIPQVLLIIDIGI